MRCIYGIVRDNRVIYVGSTTDFSKRKKQHLECIEEAYHRIMWKEHSEYNVICENVSFSKCTPQRVHYEIASSTSELGDICFMVLVNIDDAEMDYGRKITNEEMRTMEFAIIRLFKDSGVSLSSMNSPCLENVCGLSMRWPFLKNEVKN